ncbi:PKD domain-containing protein [Carboxylicivirga sp. M1479]|uniref:PKD domain-containing protein n=1 Tax=Carboxylicivirga sp. M1479 TaxID=2594476 RepID=UPI00163D7688|nr:PKD domain-containing protein [Carboxylicivirga sp. M1479]
MKQLFVVLGLIFISSFSALKAQGLSVKTLSFNEKHNDEMAPFVQDSLLYFRSNKNVKFGIKGVDQDKENMLNLFSVYQAADSTWEEPVQFMPNYFSDLNTSSIVFYPDSNEIYFTESHIKDKKELKKGTVDFRGIYVGKAKENGFKRAKSLPFNSRRSFNVGHPTLSPDGQKMFFTSDKEGGYGGYDLYFSERQGDSWGEAVNLGDVLNTGGHELFPFYHPSGKLYFASDSLGGQGGFDIFYTERTESGWERPIAMDEQINTEANEYSCYIYADGQRGYFASDRYGSSDILEFEYLFPVFHTADKQKENTFTYRFYDQMNGKGDGPLKYVWRFGDGHQAEGDTVIHKYKAEGEYHVQSVLVDTVENVELFVLNDFYQTVAKKIQVYINVPDEVKVGDRIRLDASSSNFGEFVPNGYYWELPDGSKQKGETIEYIFRTKGKHIVKCGTISMDDPHNKMCTYKEINVSE